MILILCCGTWNIDCIYFSLPNTRNIYYIQTIILLTKVKFEHLYYLAILIKNLTIWFRYFLKFVQNILLGAERVQRFRYKSSKLCGFRRCRLKFYFWKHEQSFPITHGFTRTYSLFSRDGVSFCCLLLEFYQSPKELLKLF